MIRYLQKAASQRLYVRGALMLGYAASIVAMVLIVVTLAALSRT